MSAHQIAVFLAYPLSLLLLRLFFACRLIIQLEINQEHEVQDQAGL